MKKLVSLVMVIALVFSMATVVKAAPETANLEVTLSQSTAKVKDEITVTVDWKEAMEAVDLELGFDKSKVEFVSSSMSEDYIATDRIKDGVVQVSWFSMNGKGITNITYKFKVIAEGSAKFTTAEATLADANVEQPENYTYGSKTLTIKNGETTTPSTEKPGTTTPSTEKPGTTTPSTEKPSTTTPSTEKPSTTTPSTSKPSTSTPSTNKPETTTTAKKPTTIPQAGMNVVTYAIIALVAVAVIATVAVVVKTRKK